MLYSTPAGRRAAAIRDPGGARNGLGPGSRFARPGDGRHNKRHAKPHDLDQLEDLLIELRALPLKEKSRGVFYRGSKAFLHFHGDPEGLFADVRLEGAEFDRFRVSTKQERAAFAKHIRAALKS